MQRLLGDEYAAFLATYTRPPVSGLRVNTLKISPQALQERLPLQLEPVAGILAGFRLPEEPGADVEAEKTAVESAGMKYIHIPFRRADPNPQPVVDAFVSAVKDPANRPMLFHCAAGVRASAMWAIKRVVVDGWTKEKALAEAETIGLTQDAMKKWAADYLTSQGK